MMYEYYVCILELLAMQCSKIGKANERHWDRVGIEDHKNAADAMKIDKDDKAWSQIV